MGYMAARAVFVTHQSQECMGVLTDTTRQNETRVDYSKILHAVGNIKMISVNVSSSIVTF